MGDIAAKSRPTNPGRAGTQALSLLASPLNVAMLQALEAGPLSLVDIRRGAGAPPQTTARVHLKELIAAGVVTRHRQGGFPGGVNFELSDAGRRLMDVAAVLEGWLAAAPAGPVALGSSGAKNAVKALADGWATSIVRALAARPLALTELDRLIPSLSYPSLERRLSSMRLAGLLEARPSSNSGRPYGVTAWLRQAVAPLSAAVRWEHSSAIAPIPVSRIDAEAAFLLSVPLLDLSADLSGTCRLAVEMRNGADHRFAGVLVALERGRMTSCVSRLQGPADAWATGEATRWLQAILDRNIGSLQIGGDHRLATALVEGIYRALPSLAVDAMPREKPH